MEDISLRSPLDASKKLRAEAKEQPPHIFPHPPHSPRLRKLKENEEEEDDDTAGHIALSHRIRSESNVQGGERR